MSPLYYIITNLVDNFLVTLSKNGQHSDESLDVLVPGYMERIVHQNGAG